MGISRLLVVLGVVGVLAIPGGLAGRHGAEVDIGADGLDKPREVEVGASGLAKPRGIEVVAHDLDNPRGLAFGPKRALYVAEAGRGGDGPPCIFFPPDNVDFCYGPTGGVTRIWHDEQERVVDALPSLGPKATGAAATGPHDVSFDGRRGFLVTGLGFDPAVRTKELVPVGGLFGLLWRFWPGLQRIADIAAFEAAQNPDREHDGIVFSNPYAVLATHGTQYVVDAGGNSLLQVRDDGVKEVAVFPPRDTPPGLPGPPKFESVPDSIVRGPGGDLFVGELTGFPFPVGEARVYRVSRDGDVDVYASGFTNIIDIAFDRKGNLYVLEFATNGILSGPPGALWRVPRHGDRTKSESTQIEVEGLTLVNPGGLAIGRGAIYISNHGTSAGEGEVVRIPLKSHGDEEEGEDAVLEWNLYAVQALINTPTATPPGAGQPPPVSVLHLGMVQGAVYDAVNMIDGGHEPYLDGLPPAPASASKAAAVATAAHDVLVGVNVVPPLSQAIVDRLDDLLEASIAAATVQDGSTAVTAGIAAGAAAADAMLAERANDGRYGSFQFTVGSGVGEWRPTPPGFVNDPNAWVARVDPFAMNSTSQFRTPGPKTIGSGAYRKEYDEVKNLGGNGTTTPTSRTAEQTAVAQFFTANPVEMFNRTFRGLATSEGLTLVDQARLFAMLNVSGADAAIACWDDKAYWSFWRPITAIRVDDGDPPTVADPEWTSLIASPPYPEHPSGYNCQSGAFMHAAKAFFDRKIEFSLTANLASGPMTRTYERFTDVIDDTIDARIWLGIHFRSADVDGAWIGKRAANWLAENYLRPV